MESQASRQQAAGEDVFWAVRASMVPARLWRVRESTRSTPSVSAGVRSPTAFAITPFPLLSHKLQGRASFS